MPSRYFEMNERAAPRFADYSQLPIEMNGAQ
jgi:hypothetical protein